MTAPRIPKNSKNQFEALSEKGPVDGSEPPHRSSCGCREACEGMKVNLADAVKMPSRNKLKAARRMKAFEESGEHAASPLTSLAKAKLRAEAFAGAQVADAENQTPLNSAVHGAVQMAWPGLKVFAEKRPRSLRPLAEVSEG